MNILLEDRPVTLAELSTMPSEEEIAKKSRLPPVRFSRLKKMASSPAHFEADFTEQTACMEKGSAVDHLIFQSKIVIAYPGKVRNGKDWESFKLDHPDNEFCVVTGAEYEHSRAIAAAIRADRRAMRVLRGERQKEIYWSLCGRSCVSHLDILGTNGGWVTELKVSQTSNPARFRWQALRMLYHCQLAFYSDAAASYLGREPRAHFIVCAEATYPHVVTTFKLTHRAIQLGKRCNRLWMERLLQCEAADEYPGYSQSIVDLDAPEDEIFESEDAPF